MIEKALSKRGVSRKDLMLRSLQDRLRASSAMQDRSMLVRYPGDDEADKLFRLLENEHRSEADAVELRHYARVLTMKETHEAQMGRL